MYWMFIFFYQPFTAFMTWAIDVSFSTLFSDGLLIGKIANGLWCIKIISSYNVALWSGNYLPRKEFKKKVSQLDFLKFRGAMFRGDNFPGSNVLKCKFRGSNFPGSKVPGSKIPREQCSEVQSSGEQSSGCKVPRAKFRGAKFRSPF